VPENRNSGTITNRISTAKLVSRVRVTDHAISAGANASPVSTDTGRARMTRADRAAPNAAMTARKIPQFMISRSVTNIRWPRNTSRGRSGLAAAAK
jgi:hypothetical protein